MEKFEIVEQMEWLKGKMFGAGVDYATICDFGRVIGLVNEEAQKEAYKPITAKDIFGHTTK